MPLFIIPVDGGKRNKVVCIPKPPRIGAAYIKLPRFDYPYTHGHDPDQDWLQKFALRGGFRQNKFDKTKTTPNVPRKPGNPDTPV